MLWLNDDGDYGNVRLGCMTREGIVWSGVFFCHFLFSCCSHWSAVFMLHQLCYLHASLTGAGNAHFLMRVSNRKRAELGQRNNPCRKASVVPPHLPFRFWRWGRKRQYFLMGFLITEAEQSFGYPRTLYTWYPNATWPGDTWSPFRK